MQLPRIKARLKTVPFWTDQSIHTPERPQADALPEQVDVAVVGGGYTGLSAARVLAREGATVAVLEKNSIGWGASARNGGIAPAGTVQSMQVIFKRYGERLAREFWDASLDAIDLIGETVADEGIDCHFLRKGHVTLAIKPEHVQTMEKKAAWYRANLNHHLAVVSISDLSREVGSTRFYGGLVDEWSASLDPAKYVFGLAAAAARYGAFLCEETAVQQIEKRRKRFFVRTSEGVIRANEVVVATNGHTDALVPALKRRVFPMGSYVIVTEPLSSPLQQFLSPKRRTFSDSKWRQAYFRLTPDGRLLFGGLSPLVVGADLTESARYLYAQMVDIFPELRGVRITHSWGGRLGHTFDQMPHIGRVDGVHYALGYSGHGVSMASYLGAEIGKLLCGRVARSPFMEIEHPTRFYYRKRPWFLPIIDFWYRLQDWLK